MVCPLFSGSFIPPKLKPWTHEQIFFLNYYYSLFVQYFDPYEVNLAAGICANKRYFICSFVRDLKEYILAMEKNTPLNKQKHIPSSLDWSYLIQNKGCFCLSEYFSEIPQGQAIKLNTQAASKLKLTPRDVLKSLPVFILFFNCICIAARIIPGTPLAGHTEPINFWGLEMPQNLKLHSPVQPSLKPQLCALLPY